MVTDEGLQAVINEYYRLDPEGLRTAGVLRRSLDQLYDGQHTGRYAWSHLSKTEKTHCGTLVEINLQREFKFDDGRSMDFALVGHDVDCKYSQDLGGWMIPSEAVGQLCLLLHSSDEDSSWSCGLIRALPEHLRSGGNRDSKTSLTAFARDHHIYWLFRELPLPENVLLHLAQPDRDAIFRAGSGQARVDELFRRVQRRAIGRGVVATVAQQSDYMKRVRGNGGSRTRLAPEGILVLGDSSLHREYADLLGVPVPRKGESVGVRVAPAESGWRGPRLEIKGRLWRIATEEDEVVRAPDLPNPRVAVSGDR